jgi:hypothetical protein
VEFCSGKLLIGAVVAPATPIVKGERASDKSTQRNQQVNGPLGVDDTE